MKTSLTILTLILICMACKKNNDKLSSTDGIWIEASKQKDTLYFESQTSFVDLRRGKELRNGYLLPKISAGLYSYEIKKDSISLQYLLSSLYKPSNYKFNIDLNKGKITIGNFYVDSLNRNTTLTFIKAR
jgi:hypothetical protein